MSSYIVLSVARCFVHRVGSFSSGSLHPPVRAALAGGAFRALDACDSHDRDFLTGGGTQDGAVREVLKRLLEEYNQSHRYKGK